MPCSKICLNILSVDAIFESFSFPDGKKRLESKLTLEALMIDLVMYVIHS